MIIKEYRLRHKKSKKFITVRTSSNSEGDFCCEEQHILDDDEYYPVWVAQSPEHAEWVKHNSTSWYNAEYETPSHSFKPEELEIFEVSIETSEKPVEVKLPTVLELYQSFIKKDKGYKLITLDYIQESEKKNRDMSKDFSYDIYRLKDYIRNKSKM